MILQYFPQVKFVGSELKAERWWLEKRTYIIKLHALITPILSKKIPLFLHLQLGPKNRGGGLKIQQPNVF